MHEERPHVLVVDDEPNQLVTISRILSRQGLEVHTADNGAQALEILRRESIDVMITDLNMPIMDGMEFLTALRAEDRQKQPIVVMCTTENDMPRIVQAMQAGANEYIMKPFDSEIIQTKFSQIGLI